MESKEAQQGQLEMTFTPNTIEHLGVRMYSTVPPVLAELIANSYDADAKNVAVQLKDDDQKEIIVSDDGHGMTADEINKKFLRIGRNRRHEETSQTSPGGRKVVGKKGLGKLKKR
jgi:HSP90 family molecular chaperone